MVVLAVVAVVLLVGMFVGGFALLGKAIELIPDPPSHHDRPPLSRSRAAPPDTFGVRRRSGEVSTSNGQPRQGGLPAVAAHLR